MLCLVCNARPAPTETGLCKLCDNGFHPIDQPMMTPMFSSREVEFALDFMEMEGAFRK